MSDYMKEAERLLSEYGDAVSDAVVFAQDPAGYSMRMEEATRAALLAHIQRGAPAPAEVPMPEPVAYGFGNTAITGHTNRLMMVRLDVPLDDQYAGAFWLPLVLADEAHTYGVACRAAGEAAGYARGVADERERCASVAWAHYMDKCLREGIGPDVLPDWCCAAALRGEVK